MNLWLRGLCEITWQPKIITSLLPQCLWPPNLASWWLAMMGFHTCYSTVWSRGIAKSRDTLKSLYLHYHNFYDHKMCQDDGLPWVTATQKSHDHSITWEIKIATYPLKNFYGYQFWQGRYIHWGASFHKFTRSFDHMVFQGHVNITAAASLLSQGLWTQNLAKWWLTIRNFDPIRHTTI